MTGRDHNARSRKQAQRTREHRSPISPGVRRARHPGQPCLHCLRRDEMREDRTEPARKASNRRHHGPQVAPKIRTYPVSCRVESCPGIRGATAKPDLHARGFITASRRR